MSNSDFDINVMTIPVHSLHALVYCRRLFYLEEVEKIYTQNASVFAGRRLHEKLEKEAAPRGGVWEETEFFREDWGLRGKIDLLRLRDRQIIPYEFKRGRSRRGDAWESDRIQLLAYCCLIEETYECTLKEGRIRYFGDNCLVKIPINDEGRGEVKKWTRIAFSLRKSLNRPPITDNERLCINCSANSVCLPEESRLAHDHTWQPLRLFPIDNDREILHIIGHSIKIGKLRNQIKIQKYGEKAIYKPIQKVSQIVVHGFPQISTQMIYAALEHEIGIHFLNGAGTYVGSLDVKRGNVQRRVRQYQALTQPDQCLNFSKKIVLFHGHNQRQILMRSAIKSEKIKEAISRNIAHMKILIEKVSSVDNIDSLRGLEGNIARYYFSAFPKLLSSQINSEIQFLGRSYHPTKDSVNALLNFGYALLRKEVTNAIFTVGLEPSLGFFHQPRSSAFPLVLDLMEMFRVQLIDLIVLGSINRNQWSFEEDFWRDNQRGFLLTDSGKKKMIALYEKRIQDKWEHPVLNYSISYRRLIELEVRLLEKDWTEGTNLFALRNWR